LINNPLYQVGQKVKEHIFQLKKPEKSMVKIINFYMVEAHVMMDINFTQPSIL